MHGSRERVLDGLLVLRCREGSREAFRLLVERWQERLWRHAYRLTGDSNTAWDVVQEVWVSITRDIARLDDPQHFGGWAYTIVTRRAADWRRRNGAEEPEAELDRRAAPEIDETSGGVESLRLALRHLSGERRALVSLRYVDGYEVAEIAAILGVPEGTVKSRLHAAREQLREIMERNER
jgi:RNA polymerase sigma-70 factor (ECF subfamily)